MRLATVLLAALIVGACAGSGETAEPGGDVSEEHDLAPSMEVKVGPSSVRFVLHVTNSSSAPITLNFSSSKRYDFYVETLQGEEVWRWSDGMAFMQALSEDTLAAGESWTMEAVWEPEVPPGEYQATGVLSARDHELKQRTTFQLSQSE